MLQKYHLNKEFTLKYTLNTPNNAAKRLPFYVNSSGHFKCDKEYFTEREGLNQYLLIYTLSGSGYIKYRDIEYIVPENHVFLINCREYQYYKTNSQEWEFLWLHFNGTGANEYFNLINENSFDLINIGRDSNIANIIFEIQSIISSKTELIDIKLSPIVHSLLTQILIHKFAVLNNTKHQHHKQAIDNTIAYINMNYAHAISIDDLANNVNISKYYLVKLFKVFTGQTPYDYLIGYRINASKRLLKETDESVRGIALMVGFNDIKNYIKAFKKLTGTTPLNYRLYWI
jgi:AraC-like DNA-binding protein